MVSQPGLQHKNGLTVGGTNNSWKNTSWLPELPSNAGLSSDARTLPDAPITTHKRVMCACACVIFGRSASNATPSSNFRSPR